MNIKWPFVSCKKYERLELEYKRLNLAMQQAYDTGYIEAYNKVRRIDVTDYILERLAKEWKVFPEGGSIRVDSRDNIELVKKFNAQRKKDETS